MKTFNYLSGLVMLILMCSALIIMTCSFHFMIVYTYVLKWYIKAIKKKMTSYLYHSNDSFAQNIKISRNVMAVLSKRIEQLVPINRYAQRVASFSSSHYSMAKTIYNRYSVKNVKNCKEYVCQS